MAGYCAGELDEADVHRLLPPEIFADIGIVDARRHAVVEELATRLVGILGLAGVRAESAPPPPARAADPGPRSRSHQAHRPQGSGGVYGAGTRAHAGNGGTGGMVHRPPGSVIYFDWSRVRRLPWLAPTAPCAGGNLPPAPQTGTGVFLPRAELYHSRASKSSTNGAKPPRRLRMEAANAITTQQLQLRAMAAAMEE